MIYSEDMKAVALGRELARRRREAGLSQAELAARMGTSQAAISNMESGRTLPTLSVLERFAEGTGRPLTIVVGAPSRLAGRDERRRRVRLVLGDYRFDPWERRPSKVEAQSLEADGLTRERFEGSRAAESRRR